MAAGTGDRHLACWVPAGVRPPWSVAVGCVPGGNLRCRRGVTARLRGRGDSETPTPYEGVVHGWGRLIVLISRVEKLGKTGDADLGTLREGCELPNFESLRNPLLRAVPVPDAHLGRTSGPSQGF